MTARGPAARPLSLLAALGLAAACAPPPSSAPPPLIPHPAVLEARAGAFPVTPATGVALADTASGELRRIVELWAGPLRRELALRLPVSDTGSIRVGYTGGPGAEGYRLHVGAAGVTVAGADPAGILYGLRSLEALLWAAGGNAPRRLPALDVRDAPRFGYRGMHLDVGRHFFGPDAVKRYLDVMARYKLNRFHWHLTEDQGWRIQIDRYPRLTEVGAFRKETQVARHRDPFVGDGTPYGGFYTKEEIREIVAYAAERFITVIPEIEMPGHSLAALAAYPELSCTGGPFEVGTRWGVEEDIYCPGEATFEFLQNVLLEVMELFPGPYIHIGGDEAPKTRWRESPLAQEVIRREGLADQDELQSWFIRRIEAFLNRHGRRLIGWDEILEGGLAPNATVMSWRGVAGGIEAARQGHDVIMTPTSHMYFDYYQGDPEEEPLAIGGFLPLERVYAFEPVPEELTPGEARHILGPQANLWTEYIPTEAHLQYMLLPRMLALSEVAWTPAELRSFAHFAQRLPAHLARFDAEGIRYRIPDVVGLERDRVLLDDHIRLEFINPAPGEIRYTVDGSEPGPGSLRYRGPVELDLGDGPVTVAARAVLPDGRMGAVRRARFARARLRPAVTPEPAGLAPGLAAAWVEGAFRTVAEVEAALEAGAGVRSTTTTGILLPAGVPRERFGLRLTGYLRVPEDGIYTFRLTSDDGALLRIDGETVVDHDGLHAASAREGDAALARGLHRLELLYFQAGGGRALSLEVLDATGAPRSVSWVVR